MKRSVVRRGQPLVAFTVLLGGWTVARCAAWTLLDSDPFVHEPVAAGTPAALTAKSPAHPRPMAAHPAGGQRAAAETGAAPSVYTRPLPPAIAPVPLGPVLPAPAPLAASPLPDPVASKPAADIALLGGHQLLWLAAVAKLPLPVEAMGAVAPGAAAPVPPSKLAAAVHEAKPARWSADSWLLLRRNSGPAGLAAIGGSYGASQAGAVLRYRLDPSSAHKPSLYLRLTGALNGTREQEAATGLSARMIAALPIVALAEVRASRTAGGMRVRPAAALVTELPPQALPLGFRSETYAQAGWVGGSNATGFIDGQLRIDRKLAAIGGSELRAGAGAWGGMQKGASRVDVGPTANLSFRLSDTASARVSADWRFRVSGAAAPSSGPALTLSAGF